MFSSNLSGSKNENQIQKLGRKVVSEKERYFSVKKTIDWNSRNVNCSEDVVEYSVVDAAYSEAKSGL